MVSRGSDITEKTRGGFADSPATRHTRRVIRLATLATAAVLMLTACSQNATTDPSAEPANDFCHAMATAADLAPAAAEALDGLFTTMDAMAAGSTDGDIETLHTAGAATTSASTTYADALGTAASLAPESLAVDITTLQEYWNLYAAGLGQVATDASSYGKLVDETTALSTSEQASSLVANQPDAQQRINDGYLAECSG